jgi:hypothetical protein
LSWVGDRCHFRELTALGSDWWTTASLHPNLGTKHKKQREPGVFPNIF